MKNRLYLALAVILPFLLLIASFALYYSTLAPGMLRGDSGEFQWAMVSLNVAHATGYPLFTLFGFLWQQLPLGGLVAWRLNLISALFGAAAVAMVFVASRKLTGRLDAALAAAVFFGLAPVFWFNASILEVYTLNAFLLALIVFLLLTWAAKPATSSAIYFAFLVLGLALAHHRLIVLALPGILAFMILTDRRFLLSIRRLFALALMLLPGLALYVYVPLRLVAAGASLHYAIFDIIFGQEFSASLFREYHFEQVLAQIPFQNFHAGLVLAAIGAIYLLRVMRNVAILLAGLYVADVLFALAYWVPDVEVFLTPSFVVIALWIAAGAAWLIEWLRHQLRPAHSMTVSAAAALVLVLFPFVGLGNYSVIRSQVAAEAGTSESRARTILAAGLPPGALLELDWETATAIRFIQTTELQRRDLEARLIHVDEQGEFNYVLNNVDSGRPVFVESGVNWTRAPAGYFLRAAPAGLAQVIRSRVEASTVMESIDDKVQLASVAIDSHALVLFWDVKKPVDRDLATFVHFFDEEGKPIGQQDHSSCCQTTYGYRTTQWNPGREIADNFASPPAGTTYVQIGMYATVAGDIDSYGRTIALQITPLRQSTSAHQLNIAIGDGIIARAYDLSDDGRSIQVSIYWEGVDPVAKDYTIFADLLDSAGEAINKVERQPLDGVYPTSAWREGQTVRDTLTLSYTTRPGTLEFGLKDPTTGKGVPRADGAGVSIAIEVR